MSTLYIPSLCFAYVEWTTVLHVWSNPNQSNRGGGRSALQWYITLWWVFSDPGKGKCHLQSDFVQEFKTIVEQTTLEQINKQIWMSLHQPKPSWNHQFAQSWICCKVIILIKLKNFLNMWTLERLILRCFSINSLKWFKNFYRFWNDPINY